MRADATSDAARSTAKSRSPSRFVRTIPQSKAVPSTSLQRCAIEEPIEKEHGGEHEEDVEEHVGLGDVQPTADSRRDQDEKDERPKDPRGDVLGQNAGERPDESDPEEPVLDVERDDVGASHGVERGGVERRARAADTPHRGAP